MVFIEYEQTFDSVETSAVMKVLRWQEVEDIYGKILEDIYKECITIKQHLVSVKIPI